MAKAFTFTYSKIKNYEQCGLQHWATDIAKLPGMEPSGDAIDYGNQAHAVLHAALKNNEPLPPRFKHLQYWVDYVKRLAELPGAQLFVEEKWAIDRVHGETPYFSGYGRPAPYMRFNCDVAVIAAAGRMGWLLDWKTGNRLEEPLQLWMGAAIMFALFPLLERVSSAFVWLKEDDGKNSNECISVENIKREEIDETWEQLQPRIDAYEDAVASGTFLAKPGRHCRWCKYQKCEHWGAK